MKRCVLTHSLSFTFSLTFTLTLTLYVRVCLSDTTYHRTNAEISRVGKALILVEQVLEERDTTIKVDIDLLAKLLLSLDGSHHGGLRDGVLGSGPGRVLGILQEAAELLVEVETNVEVQIVTLLILVQQADTLGVHISVLDGFPSNATRKDTQAQTTNKQTNKQGRKEKNQHQRHVTIGCALLVVDTG
jgi:hypothetical protein